MRFNNALPGGVLMLFALAVIAYSNTFPRLHGQNYGPDLFPTLIGTGLLVFGGILVFQGLKERATAPMVDIGEWAKDRRNIANVVILLASMIFYILISDMLGFIPTSLLIMVTLLRRFGSGWPASVVLALLTTFAIHTLFAKLLLVPLPWGILLPVAW